MYVIGGTTSRTTKPLQALSFLLLMHWSNVKYYNTSSLQNTCIIQKATHCMQNLSAEYPCNYFLLWTHFAESLLNQGMGTVGIAAPNDLHTATYATSLHVWSQHLMKEFSPSGKTDTWHFTVYVVFQQLENSTMRFKVQGPALCTL